MSSVIQVFCCNCLKQLGNFYSGVRGDHKKLSEIFVIGMTLVVTLSTFSTLLVARNKLLNGSFDFINNSMLASVLAGSDVLKFSHICLLVSTVPLAFDTILDIEQSRHQGFGPFFPLDLRIRSTFILCNVIPSAFYLATYSTWFCPLVYIIFNQITVVAVFSIVVLYILSIKFGPPTKLLLLSITSYYLCVVIKVFAIVKNNNIPLQHVAMYLTGVCYFSLLLAMFTWLRRLIYRAKRTSDCSGFLQNDSEKICCTYVVMFLLFWIATFISNALTHSSFWLSSSEANLVSYVILQFLFVVPATILPGRLARSSRFLAERLLDQKRAYVRYVSHEIRSPLNVVSAGLDLLAQGILMAPQLDSKAFSLELLGDITDATETAINILNDLLQYESVDAGNIIIDPVPMHPTALLRMRKLALICRRHDINMQIAALNTNGFDLASLCARADIYRIDQVTRNLVSNACKFTSCGGTISVRSSIELFQGKFDYKGSDPKGKLTIFVQDTGIGIADANKAQVFGEFKQFDKNNLQSGGGSGLGLWICKRIIQMHGGTIGFTSEGQGKGATFFFELPLFHYSSDLPLDADTESMQIALMPPNSSESDSQMIEMVQVSTSHSVDYRADIETGHQKQPRNVDQGCHSSPNTDAPCNLRVLLVDDSMMNRKVVRRMFDAEDDIIFDVVEAEDGVDAFNMMSESVRTLLPFDLVLIDSVMKVKHGPETVENIRNELGYKELIVGLTGNALPEDISSFTSKGLDACLLKPLKRVVLHDTIQKAVDRKLRDQHQKNV